MIDLLWMNSIGMGHWHARDIPRRQLLRIIPEICNLARHRDQGALPTSYIPRSVLSFRNVVDG